MGTAPYYQRPEFCCHQSSRDTVTHTETLDSGTGGRYGLGQGQSRLDGRVKPEECIPCGPIMLAWLPAEAANAAENCCANSRLQPAPSAGDLWAGAEAKLPQGLPNRPL